jgi:hypothetical protein
MYIKPVFTYYCGTEQRSRAGPFLLLIQPDKSTIADTCTPSNTYAVVRRVALRQLGHFMMGRANINGKWHSVSGAYGSDGLPMSINTLPRDAKALPADLYDAWKSGGGWNGAGSEAPAMRAWALQEFKL